MENVAVTGQLIGQVERLAVLQTGGVTGGHLPAQVVPGIDMLEFGAEHSGVEVVQAAIEAEAVDVALGGAVIGAVCAPSRRCRHCW